MAERPPVAIVTGAASGIGNALAQRLAGLGYRLVLIDIDHAGLSRGDLAVAGADHELVAADVADRDAWVGLARTLEHDGADVALLVQAAGVLLAGPLVDCDGADIERIVAVNLAGVLLGSAAIGPLLAASAERGGPTALPRGLLNVASVFASITPPGFAAYNATKAAVVATTETLREEWRPAGLTATAVLPGVTPTGLFDRAVYADDRLRELVADRATGSKLTAEGVARAAIEAYRRGRLVAPIGGRASRLHGLKRWLPNLLRRRIAAEADRALRE